MRENYLVLLPKRLSFLFLFVLLINSSFFFSQETLSISGVVYSYDNDPGQKLFKKKKQIVLEGSLDGVTITLTDKGKKIKTVKTNKKGEFKVEVPLGREYMFEFSKNGHDKSHFEIDATVPDDFRNSSLRFKGMELILNSHISDKIDLYIGKLFYNASTKRIDFEKVSIKDANKSTQRRLETPLSLMEQSISKNKNFVVKNSVSKGETIVKETDSTNITETTSKKPVNVKYDFFLKNSEGIENISEENIDQRESEIEKAWAQIEEDKKIAVTEEDFLIIQQRETLLIAAEKELENARAYIDLQKSQLGTQRIILFWMIGFILLLLGFAFVIYRNYKQKKTTNLLLEKKNKKIIDSIGYASRIQKSILLSEEEVKEIIPNSFIFYQPLGLVSGDFYWFAKVNHKIIIAAVDCTGHGVPGAFMSLIGNTHLNEIILAKHITDAADILTHLNESIIKSLRQKESKTSSQDGMDMSLCVIDTKTRKLQFSGARNPIFFIKNGEISKLKADRKGIGGTALLKRKKKPKESKFTNQEIDLDNNTNVYLFSDGYQDQFGGEKDEKYSIKKFKELIVSNHTKDMGEQKELLKKSINDWKGDARQIDDILVIGFKL